MSSVRHFVFVDLCEDCAGANDKVARETMGTTLSQGKVKINGAIFVVSALTTTKTYEKKKFFSSGF